MVTRRTDHLGRIVLPIEARTELGIADKEELSICVKNGEIVLKKAQPTCVICNNTKQLTVVNGKSLCSDCIAKIKATA